MTRPTLITIISTGITHCTACTTAGQAVKVATVMGHAATLDQDLRVPNGHSSSQDVAVVAPPRLLFRLLGILLEPSEHTKWR